MVQSLAAVMWKLPVEQRDRDAVDTTVRRDYLDGKIEHNIHFRFIRNYLLASPDLRRLLKLYRRVLQGKKPVVADEQDPLQNHLKLAGVVRMEEARLLPCNRIYRRIFDLDWIKSTSPGICNG